jgi:hypothetical protein
VRGAEHYSIMGYILVRPPISELLASKPWLIPRLVSGDIPDD